MRGWRKDRVWHCSWEGSCTCCRRPADLEMSFSAAPWPPPHAMPPPAIALASPRFLPPLRPAADALTPLPVRVVPAGVSRQTWALLDAMAVLHEWSYGGTMTATAHEHASEQCLAQ
jgi:hypothetical protein